MTWYPNGRCAALAATALTTFALPAYAQEVFDLGTITVKAASEELKQALGASTITEEDLERALITNDVSELVKRQPGVNLTGNTSTGRRGNQRQIDLRGMGPENTLILIDGRPVLSRNSVRMDRSGERDTRGDSNWVPASVIDRIEVVRGPAAARYGSGSAGGVVNIITKAASEPTTELSLFAEVPESDKEGANYRATAAFSGPIGERLSYRSYLSANKSEADDADINADATEEGGAIAAGQEGLKNYDLSTLLEFRSDAANTWGVELSYSKQANLYAGDSLFQSVDRVYDTTTGEALADLVGETTNTMQRSALALTHRGDYDFGTSNSFLQWEHTDNKRRTENLFGGVEGMFTGDDYNVTLLDNVSAKTEWNLYSQAFGVSQTLTLGAEYRGEFMKDPSSLQQATMVEVEGTESDPADRDDTLEAHLIGLYVEENMELDWGVTLTPGLRVDHHSTAGTNWSPSLNMSWEATPEITVKAGVSRAFKAPNLFQTNPNYVYFTNGNACPADRVRPAGGCHILGNEDLEHETSWNKEIGISYQNLEGFNAGLTFFKNDYENKIGASLEPFATVSGSEIYQWENAELAVVEGFEGNLRVPLSDALTWTTNATVMRRSENRDTGQPLSLVPDYTINTQFDWDYRDNWSFTLAMTHYGATESPTQSATNGAKIENADDRDPYTLVNLSTNYEFDHGFSMQAGIKNLFNTEILREGASNDAGANTYNEPGRSYTLALTKSF
ncbi:ferric enterobactin receptor [Poseidonocella pacifica]|uniref:Ferric enterobactin receptor n=1 Tax=Poseidonocella pacifica TaxID=871651 RepID=A0A1I0WRQ0_9RHOB|nr:FepA family TonB-dependent siderophore receptor [Poseidonocella pacifica]SFA90653.1 ferric enterobactin receptor [Poseidonocella pacifica]